MRKTLTTRTLSVFTGSTAAGMTFADVTVLLVRMTYAQLRSWSWVGDEWTGEAVHEGWEVRDVTGALLGAVLPIGHHATRIHAEWYDPATDDFYAAGETNAPVLTQGIARVLDSRAAHVGAVPAGDPFVLDEPRFLPVRVDCWAGVCPARCPECEADYVRQEEARRQYAAA